MREFKAAVIAVAGLALSLLFGVIAFRVITPSILEAHFDGGTLVATLVALALAGLIVAFTAYWVRLVARRLTTGDHAADKEEGDHAKPD